MPTTIFLFLTFSHNSKEHLKFFLKFYSKTISKIIPNFLKKFTSSLFFFNSKFKKIIYFIKILLLVFWEFLERFVKNDQMCRGLRTAPCAHDVWNKMWYVKNLWKQLYTLLLFHIIALCDMWNCVLHAKYIGDWTQSGWPLVAKYRTT